MIIVQKILWRKNLQKSFTIRLRGKEQEERTANIDADYVNAVERQEILFTIKNI